MAKPHYRAAGSGQFTYIGDGLQSFATRMGTDQAKSNTASYAVNVLRTHQLEAAFRTSWVAKKLVRIPPFDATRKWRMWKGDLSEKVESLEKAFNVRQKTFESSWKSRLYGGAVMLIGVNGESLSEPLEIERVRLGSLRYLTPLARTQITAGIVELDPREARFGRPKDYQLTTGTGEMLRVHPTRLVEFLGEELPSNTSGGGGVYGWADSILQTAYEACRNLDATMANIADLVFDAKTDVIKIPGLTGNITNAHFEAALLTRFATARMLKGNNGTLILDANEDYQSKAFAFGGMDSIVDRFMQVASGAADIPMTRMFGMSPGGLNSTGDGDLHNYHDHISALQELEMTPSMSILDEVLIRSATGTRPDDLMHEWRPLRQMSEAQRSEIRSRDATTVSTLASSGVYADEEVAEAGRQMMRETGLDAISEGDMPPPEDDEETDEAGDMQTDAAPRTLYIRRDVVNAEEVIAWAKTQGFSTTLPADDLHVTIAFSRTPVDWMRVGQSWEPEIKVTAGGPRLMEKFGRANVLLFASSALSWRHEEIKREGASWDHPEYQPHITISYADDAPDLKTVEPFSGEIILGPEVFQEVKEDWQQGITEK